MKILVFVLRSGPIETGSLGQSCNHEGEGGVGEGREKAGGGGGGGGGGRMGRGRVLPGL